MGPHGSLSAATGLLLTALALPGRAAEPASAGPVIKVIPSGEQTNHLRFRRTLVGPGVNQPRPYPGYTGFVGWQGMARTRTGALLVTFSSGYWHASPPTPLEGIPARYLKELIKAGMPENVDAPRGGRAEVIRSDDGGRTWTAPETLIDTPWDDRAPAAVQLSDGTLLASFFIWPGKNGKRVGIIRSTDDGKTWSRNPSYLGEPFTWAATDGPPIELPDKSVLVVAYAGRGVEETDRCELGVYRSTDRGVSWKRISTLSAPYDLDEPSIARLPDGRLVIICRPEGALSWSSDGGRTWTPPVKMPTRMYDPWLLVLKDGTLLCVHGSYTRGRRGLRAILSPDGGKTWTAAGPDYGFSIDPSVYGYSRGVQMPDGSIYLAYQATGGHRPEDARRESIFALRFKVLDGCRGIELLPAPGSPADLETKGGNKAKE
jgi:hypothetical protein